MKRFLLLFCAAVLACSIMIVPAFAAEAIIFTPDQINNKLVESFPAGSYVLNVYDEDGLFWSYPEFTVDKESGVTIYDDDGSPDGTPFILEIHYEEQGVSILIGACNDVAEDCCSFSDMWSVSYYEFVPVGSDVPDPEPDLGSGDPLSDVFGVFSPIGVWIGSSFGPLIGIFWNGSGLTFIGVLSVAALAIALIFLLFVIVVRFLKFSG